MFCLSVGQILTDIGKSCQIYKLVWNFIPAETNAEDSNSNLL